jgi:hypothetical protein
MYCSVGAGREKVFFQSLLAELHVWWVGVVRWVGVRIVPSLSPVTPLTIGEFEI